MYCTTTESIIHHRRLCNVNHWLVFSVREKVLWKWKYTSQRCIRQEPVCVFKSDVYLTGQRCEANFGLKFLQLKKRRTHSLKQKYINNKKSRFFLRRLNREIKTKFHWLIPSTVILRETQIVSPNHAIHFAISISRRNHSMDLQASDVSVNANSFLGSNKSCSYTFYLIFSSLSAFRANLPAQLVY